MDIYNIHTSTIFSCVYENLATLPELRAQRSMASWRKCYPPAPRGEQRQQKPSKSGDRQTLEAWGVLKPEKSGTQTGAKHRG